MKSETRNVYVSDAVRNNYATAGQIGTEIALIVAATVIDMAIVAGGLQMVVRLVAARMSMPKLTNAAARQHEHC